MNKNEGELKKRILENAYTGDGIVEIPQKDLDKVLDEAKKEILTFKEFSDAGMMKEPKPDFSDIYSVYISRMIEKWFGDKNE
jgi:hypothetical protein